MDEYIKLLGYVAASLFFFMALMLLLTLRQGARVRGATRWLWSTLAVATGIALNTSQGSLPPFFSIMLSNVLIICGAALGAYGTFEYRYERALPLRWLAAATGVLLLVFVLLREHLAGRILIVAIPTAGICLWHAWTMMAGSRLRPNARGVIHTRFGLPHAIMVLGLVIMGFVFLLRAGDTIAALRAGVAPIPPGGPTRTVVFTYAVGLAARLLLLIGMVLVLIDEMANDLRTLALRDSLTGLLNRHGLKDAVGQLPLEGSSLLMLDLDHFKSVNDDFGHEQGDRVIALFARCAQTSLPANAVLARLGGEEFCALLPQASAAEAYAAADALRADFANTSATLGHTRSHTVSIGVTTYSATATTLSKLMQQADQALYRAKHEGRNRVATAVL
ncbi:MAG TPA: GGDEF domain-containing protein [Casimicrobium sp.]|nr:GGDEF domain-containing protein [Casimicrobium sp.]